MYYNSCYVVFFISRISIWLFLIFLFHCWEIFSFIECIHVLEHIYNNCFIFLVCYFWHLGQHECTFSDFLFLLMRVVIFSASSLFSNFEFYEGFMDIMNKMLLRVWILYYSKEIDFCLFVSVGIWPGWIQIPRSEILV